MNNLVPRGADRRTTGRRPAAPRSHRRRPAKAGRCTRCLSLVGRFYRYCACCGLRLEYPAEAGSRLERRTITVLFVDIAGFTELSARLEPETLHVVQTEYFRCVAEIIRRWGGIVEKYIGDAVMAVFGASGADARHAFRAVRAGMQIVAALRHRRFSHGHRLRARVGIATGDAVVDPGAADGGQGIATGNVVNIACRVQSHATAGTVAVTDATRRATGSRVSYRRLAPVRVAGRPEPVELWRPAEPTGAPRCATPLALTHNAAVRCGPGAAAPGRPVCGYPGQMPGRGARTHAPSAPIGRPKQPPSPLRVEWAPPTPAVGAGSRGDRRAGPGTPADGESRSDTTGEPGSDPRSQRYCRASRVTMPTTATTRTARTNLAPRRRAVRAPSRAPSMLPHAMTRPTCQRT